MSVIAAAGLANLRHMSHFHYENNFRRYYVDAASELIEYAADWCDAQLRAA